MVCRFGVKDMDCSLDLQATCSWGHGQKWEWLAELQGKSDTAISGRKVSEG